MKRVLSVCAIAVVCLVMAMPVKAQLQFGVKGGVNLSSMSFGNIKGNFTGDNMTGFYIGPMADLTVPLIGIGLDAALMYSQRGDITGQTEDGTSITLKQRGLEIPINLKYTIGLGSLFGIYFAAGPDFFFNFASGTDMFKKEKTQVGLNLGAGVKLIRHLQVGFNYQIPMGNSFNVGDAVNAAFSKSKTKTWQISLAYMF
ncbi:MAG: porin family protein [Prevotellaceae bacterium]|jgi:opacity protein-like surface antigen|nr:porin family protein [Prevotellaceae bacterium]